MRRSVGLVLFAGLVVTSVFWVEGVTADAEMVDGLAPNDSSLLEHRKLQSSGRRRSSSYSSSRRPSSSYSSSSYSSSYSSSPYSSSRRRSSSYSHSGSTCWECVPYHGQNYNCPPPEDRWDDYDGTSTRLCRLQFVLRDKCSAHVVPPGDSEDQLACAVAGCQYRRCVGRGGGSEGGLEALILVVAILAVCPCCSRLGEQIQGRRHWANKSKGAKFVQLDETTGAPSALVPQPPAAVAVSPEQAALRRQWFEGNWVITWADGKWCCASSSLCLRSATHNATSHNVRVGV